METIYRRFEGPYWVIRIVNNEGEHMVFHYSFTFQQRPGSRQKWRRHGRSYTEGLCESYADLLRDNPQLTVEV